MNSFFQKALIFPKYKLIKMVFKLLIESLKIIHLYKFPIPINKKVVFFMGFMQLIDETVKDYTKCMQIPDQFGQIEEA